MLNISIQFNAFNRETEQVKVERQQSMCVIARQQAFIQKFTSPVNIALVFHNQDLYVIIDTPLLASFMTNPGNGAHHIRSYKELPVDITHDLCRCL